MKAYGAEFKDAFADPAATFKSNASGENFLSAGDTVDTPNPFSGDWVTGRRYEFIGDDQSLNLSTEDFSDETLWQDLGDRAERLKERMAAVLVAFSQGDKLLEGAFKDAPATFRTNSLAEATLSMGDTVEVVGDPQGGGDAGHRYEYTGLTERTVDLATEDFSDDGLWKDLGSEDERSKSLFLNFLITLNGYDNGNFGTEGLFDTWVQSTTDGQAKTTAGSISLLFLTQTATATIASNARINTDAAGNAVVPASAPGSQAVSVTAASVNDAINLVGSLKLPEAPSGGALYEKLTGGGKKGDDSAKPAPAEESAPATTSASGVAIGFFWYGNNVQARIEDGVVLHADSLKVTANTTALGVTLVAAGDKASSSSTQGTIGSTVVVNTTLAQVDNGATIDVGSTAIKGADERTIDPLAAGAAVLVAAVDTTNAITVAGSVAVSQAITPAMPAASAVRRMAPRLPGFSTPSITSTGRSAATVNASSGRPENRTTPTTPSLRLPNAIFSNGLRASTTSRVPRVASDSSMQSRSASAGASASRNTSTTSTPAAAARASSRRPSTSARPVSRRASASRSRAACRTRGLDVLVICSCGFIGWGVVGRSRPAAGSGRRHRCRRACRTRSCRRRRHRARLPVCRGAGGDASGASGT